MALEIPWQQLSTAALQGVIEEFITREGTDYGEREIELSAKVDKVVAQLKAGEVVIVFDNERDACQLVTRQSLSAGVQ